MCWPSPLISGWSANFAASFGWIAAPSQNLGRHPTLRLEMTANRDGLDSLQRGSGAHGRNGRDSAVDQEVCPDDVSRIVRREVHCQLRDFQRIGHPPAWIVGAEDVLNRLALRFAWEAAEHCRVGRARAQR